jgi:hypothetical protein
MPAAAGDNGSDGHEPSDCPGRSPLSVNAGQVVEADDKEQYRNNQTVGGAASN